MPKHQVKMVMENQRTLVIPILDANNWIHEALILGITNTGHHEGNNLMPSRIPWAGNIKMSQGKVPLNVLAMDSGASVNILINDGYITNMKKAREPVTIHCSRKSWKETQTGFTDRKEIERRA